MTWGSWLKPLLKHKLEFVCEWDEKLMEEKGFWKALNLVWIISPGVDMGRFARFLLMTSIKLASVHEASAIVGKVVLIEQFISIVVYV